jgi:hypothetical protein
MKYVFVTYEFFCEYWGEISHAATLTVSLWSEIIALAPKLAAKWKETAQEQEK